MTNIRNKELCLKLMKSDSEDEVIEILKEEGYWDDPSVWRFYGNTQDNYSAAGAQANEAESALVEKITNSRDARLMLECYLNDINPKSDRAPTSLKNAIGEFFNIEKGSDVEGDIASIEASKRTELARGMTLAVTGEKPGKTKYDGYPCITISDDGEGQTPDNIPETILSLNKSIKNEIEFTHGKFNMGGTAALTFCGEKNIQLVISRRHPKLVQLQIENPIKRDREWGFTIVRREFPEGKRMKSWYKYLAPVDLPYADEKGVLSFEASTMNIFPTGNRPYDRSSEWGTLIKLYNYQTKYRSQAMLNGGIRGPLDLLLPEIGLPLRVHECRDYSGHKGSFDNNVNGLVVRIGEEHTNLELKRPISTPIVINHQKFLLSIYVFKGKDRARRYREADKALVFTLNGQAQGWEHERFFTKKSVKKPYLKESMIVFVDCSQIDYTTQEMLFSNTRDRLSTKKIKELLISEIEDSLANNSVLRELHEKRRREITADKLQNSRPLEDALRTVIQKNKSLSDIFKVGSRALGKFKPDRIPIEVEDYEGMRFPTYFHLYKLKPADNLERIAHIGSKCRIKFETDAANDYFERENSKGEFILYAKDNGGPTEYGDYKVDLSNGIATLTINLPEHIQIGDTLLLKYDVRDPSRLYDPFSNDIILHIREETKDKPKPKPSSTGINMPEFIKEVAESPNEGQISWSQVSGNDFDDQSALRIISNDSDDDEYNPNGYDWYINVDNKYLANNLKNNPIEPAIIMAQYKYSLILLGISVLYYRSINDKKGIELEEGSEMISITEHVQILSEAISPVLIPIINDLSKVTDEPHLIE